MVNSLSLSVEYATKAKFCLLFLEQRKKVRTFSERNITEEQKEKLIFEFLHTAAGKHL